MKIVYIAHPVRGDVEGNLQKVVDIGQKINWEEPHVVAFVPYYYDCATLQDAVCEEHAKGLKNNGALIQLGCIDERRLYGDRISSGMKMELRLAHELNIPVVPMTKRTQKDYERCINKT